MFDIVLWLGARDCWM